jgi:ribonuclease BN (tRNA processing enzyme)
MGSLTVRAAPTDHSVPSLAFRVDESDMAPGIVFTGDGEATPELVTMAAAGDHLLVAESSAPPGVLLDGHMNPRQAGELARRCGSLKLILSHLNPGCRDDEVKAAAMEVFDREVLVAHDGLVIKV